MARPTEYDDALKSAFGRVADVSSEQARAAADRMEASGRAERAAQLREYAADLDALEAEPAPKANPAQRRAPKTAVAPARSRARSKPKRRSATARALRDAATEPDRRIASAITSTASIGWTVAGGIVSLVLVYLLVTKGSRSLSAVRELETIARAAIYPPAAFPEYHRP